jgi:hypothetical protein
MDWSKLQGLGSKAQDIFQMAKESFGESENSDETKSLFGNKEKEELEAMTLQLEEQKKKQETTLMYVIGALVVLMFTGIIKIGK